MNVKFTAMILAAVAASAVTAQDIQRTPAPQDAAVYIISPAAGETVTSPVTIKFGLSGMGVAPAGIDRENTGHHHLLIDIDDDAMPPLNQPLPATNQVRHFGGGQTEVRIELEPGEHSLQLVLGDQTHMPHIPPVMSERISITVE